MFGQSIVEHGEVGLYEVANWQVLVQQVTNKCSRFVDHGELQKAIELRIQVAIGARKVDVSEVKPSVTEVDNKALGMWMLQQAFDMLCQNAAVRC